MTDTVIRTANLGKRYRLGELEPFNTLRDSVARAMARSSRKDRSALTNESTSHNHARSDGHIWALRNVSLEVKQGEVVGIIGGNGAGKTTFLKILSRITEPTEGWAEIRGRVASLLEVGTGFHFELTGRENVYLNGAILGMRKAEIDRKFDQIVDFAEVRRFIDTPIKKYSSGMRIRLGFAVAAYLEPEILLVDEVLSVGDAAFQRKSMGKMEGLASEGRTVIFVSHNMAAIQNLCTVAYALDHGEIFASGDANDVISQYLERFDRSQTVPLSERTDRTGTGKIRLNSFSISGAMNSPDTVQTGSPASFEITFEGTPPLLDVDVDILFFDHFGQCALLAGTNLLGKDFREAPPRGTFVCRFEKFPLLPGTYHVNLAVGVKSITADWIKDAVTIHVVEGDYYGSGKLPPPGYGHVAVPYDWEVVG